MDKLRAKFKGYGLLFRGLGALSLAISLALCHSRTRAIWYLQVQKILYISQRRQRLKKVILVCVIIIFG